MNELGRAFREHILRQSVVGCEIQQLDDEHFELTTPAAVGRVNFYAFDGQPEIVELSIVDADCPGDPKFFLHFELDDLQRAQELFGEMLSELADQDLFDTTRVLLCCTAGFTTTMFANKLSEAAQTLSLDYSFEAMPLAQAKEQGGAYDAVLLAPQVAYQRKDVAAAFPDAAVVVIPTKVFASYDAGGALRMVMHLLSDNTVFPSEDSSDLRLARDMKNDYRIMVVTVVNRPRNVWMGWRVVDHGETVAHGHVTKCKHDLRDVEDLLASLHVQGINVCGLDAVGIAVPGVVNRGTVAFAARDVTDYELGRRLSERYDTKVFVDNNANAAAVGCYVSQDQYDSVVLHTQQTGYVVGGEGIVVDGHLVKGRMNYAGELSPLNRAIRGADRDEWDWDGAWTPEGMLELVAPVLAANTSLIAPDAIYVAIDLLDDMDALREEMKRYFGPGQDIFIPDLIHVTDYRARVGLGEYALCLQKLNNPRPHRKH